MPHPLTDAEPLTTGSDRAADGGSTGAADGTAPGAVAAVDELAGLVDSAKDGDHRAFAQLVDATYMATYTLALRITGEVEEARDVTQEAYLRAYRSLAQFRGDAQFTTWMYRITANCASTSLRRRRRHRHDELPENSEIVDLRHDTNPELRADASDLRDRLLEALDGLPPKLRAVVVLRDVYELSHDAIATELGISVTAAKVRLHRARHRLRAEVFPDGEEGDGVEDEGSEGSVDAAANGGGSSAKGAGRRAV